MTLWARIAIIAVLLSLSACQVIAPTRTAPEPSAEPGPQSWEAVLAEARREGRVVVAGPPGGRIRANMVEGFSRAFPEIEIEWKGGRSGDQAIRLEAERRSGIYSLDVMVGGTTTANTQVKPIGALAPIKPALMLPEVTDPRAWLDGRLDFSDRDEMNLVFINVPKVNAIFNPRQVRLEEVDELDELLDSKWQGRIAINDPIPSGAGNVLYRWFWEVLGPERAPDFIRQTAALAGAVDGNQRRQVEWIARGRYAVLLGPSDGLLQQLLEEGVNVGVVPEFKEHGTAITASFGSIMMIDRAPHPNAAKVFVNWLLSRDGQTAYSTAMNQTSRRLDVPTDHLPEYMRIKPGVRYWKAYDEAAVHMPRDLERLLREVFGR